MSVEVFRRSDGRYRRAPAIFLAFSYTEWGKLRERGHLEDLGVDERIILKLIFREYYGGLGLDCSGLG